MVRTEIAFPQERSRGKILSDKIKILKSTRTSERVIVSWNSIVTGQFTLTQNRYPPISPPPVSLLSPNRYDELVDVAILHGETNTLRSRVRGIARVLTDKKTHSVLNYFFDFITGQFAFVCNAGRGRMYYTHHRCIAFGRV